MRTRLIDSLQRLVGRTLNVKISNYRKFQELLARADAAAASDWPVFPALSPQPYMLPQVDDLKKQPEEIRAIEEMYRGRLNRLNASHQQFISRQLRSLSTLIAASARKQDQLAAALRASKEIAFVVMTSIAQFTQLKALAGSTALRAKYDLVVVGYVETAESGIVDFCKASGITLLSHDLQTVCGEHFVSNSEPDAELLAIGPVSAAASEEDRNVVQALSGLLAEIRRQRVVAIGAQRLLLHSGASLLVMFEENAEHVTGIWVSVAQELLIPSVIIPYTIADALEPAEAHYHDPIFWPDYDIYNRMAKIAAPHWLYCHRDRWLLRRSGAAILAAETLGASPPAPWVLNSSKAEAIAVESEAMRKHYLAQGIPEGQLAVTGSVTDDLMYNAMRDRARLFNELELDSDRPVFLCSMPPNQLAATRPTCEFPNFHAIADFWLSELKKLDDWQVVLKAHPAMRTTDVDYLKTFGFRMSALDTTSLIPLCDLYNPSVSSTIRWALACGKPVLNYDVYKYCYQDFVSEPAVLTVLGAAEFSGTLRRLTSDRETLALHTEYAKAAATRWGMLDGHCMGRIVDLFDGLVVRGSRTR